MWQSLRDNFQKEQVKITKRTSGEGIPDNHSSQWKYYQQHSFLTDVFTPRNMKSNIPPPDVDIIVVDINEVMCDWLKNLMSKRCQQSHCQNPKIQVQLQITRFQLTQRAIRRQGGKVIAEKSRHFLSCWHWKKEILNHWRRLCNRNRLCLLEKTKTANFWWVCCLIVGTYRKDD